MDDTVVVVVLGLGFIDEVLVTAMEVLLVVMVLVAMELVCFALEEGVATVVFVLGDTVMLEPTAYCIVTHSTNVFKNP